MELLIQYPCLVNELRTEVTVIHGSYPNPKLAKRCVALWDTGASDTTLSEKAVELLGLERVDGMEPKSVKTANGIVKSYAYWAYMQFDPGWPQFRMVIWSMPHSDIEVLIGMDVISRGIFRLWPENGKTMLRFALPLDKSEIIN